MMPKSLTLVQWQMLADMGSMPEPAPDTYFELFHSTQWRRTMTSLQRRGMVQETKPGWWGVTPEGFDAIKSGGPNG